MRERRGAEEAEIADCSCEGMVAVEKKEKKNVTSSPHLASSSSEAHRFPFHPPELTRQLFQPNGQRPKCRGLHFGSARP